jgi:hypothetical protein
MFRKILPIVLMAGCSQTTAPPTRNYCLDALSAFCEKATECTGQPYEDCIRQAVSENTCSITPTTDDELQWKICELDLMMSDCEVVPSCEALN